MDEGENGDKEKSIEEEGEKWKLVKLEGLHSKFSIPITSIKEKKLTGSLSIYAYINEAWKNLSPQKKWLTKSGCFALKGKMQEIRDDD